MVSIIESVHTNDIVEGSHSCSVATKAEGQLYTAKIEL